jgi:hypothetical protein
LRYGGALQAARGEPGAYTLKDRSIGLRPHHDFDDALFQPWLNEFDPGRCGFTTFNFGFLRESSRRSRISF